MSIITVTPTDSFGCSFPIDGARVAVIIDMHQWASLAQLSAALNALAVQSNKTAIRARSRGCISSHSEPTARSLGPYDCGAYAVAGENMRMFLCKDDWGANIVAQSEKQGPAIGSVHAAIVVDTDTANFAAITNTAIAGALQALEGRLP